MEKKSGNMENEGYKYCAHLSKAEKVKFVEKVLIVIKQLFIAIMMYDKLISFKMWTANKFYIE